MSERPGVEPLSSAAWARIRTGVVADLDRIRAARVAATDLAGRRPLRRRLALAGAAAAAAVVVLIAVHMWPAQRTPATWRVATQDEPSSLALEDADIQVAARSSVVVSLDPTGDIALVLEHGEVDCEVAPREGRGVFSVRAADVLVTVVGTRFSVALRDGDVRVEVQRGIVAVRANDGDHRVEAGQVWSTEVRTARLSSTTPEAADESRSGHAPSARHAARTAPAGADVGEESAEVAPATSGEPAEPAVLPDEPPTSPPSRLRTEALTSGAPDRGEDEGAPARDDGSRSAKPDRPDRVPAGEKQARKQRARPRLSPAQQRKLFARAQKKAKSDPEGAIELFARVARGKGTWAALALYAQADLELQQGQVARATSLLREYLRRFPRGPNADDARRNLERIE